MITLEYFQWLLILWLTLMVIHLHGQLKSGTKAINDIRSAVDILNKQLDTVQKIATNVGFMVQRMQKQLFGKGDNNV